MGFGIKIKDASGNTVKLTPETANVISSGTETMPNSLVDTDKYYVGIDLPGTDAIAIDNVSCIMNAFLLQIYLVARVFALDGGAYAAYLFVDDSVSNYTKNLTTGVMTAWTPGDCSDILDINDWDPVCTIYPDVYWDKLGASTITAVKMFGAMRYNVRDASISAFIDAYQIGVNGVKKVDYMVSMRRKITEN